MQQAGLGEIRQEVDVHLDMQGVGFPTKRPSVTSKEQFSQMCNLILKYTLDLCLAA